MQNRHSAEQIGLLLAIATTLIALAIALLFRCAQTAPARQYRDAAFVCGAGRCNDV